jgi:diguanylate cyclase (GGDEF)-like protein/PAS domain S-box-containing protein
MNPIVAQRYWTRENPARRHLWRALVVSLFLSMAGAVWVVARDMAALARVLGPEAQAVIAQAREAEEMRRELLLAQDKLAEGDLDSALEQAREARLRFYGLATQAPSEDWRSSAWVDLLARLRRQFNAAEQALLALRAEGSQSSEVALRELGERLDEAAATARLMAKDRQSSEFGLRGEARDIAAQSRRTLGGVALLALLLGAALYRTSRRSLTIARRAAETFRLAAAAVEGAIFDRDLARGEVEWSDGLANVFGHPLDHAQRAEAWFLEIIHPDDRDLVQRELEDVALSGGEFDLEYRMRDGNGLDREVWCRGQVIADPGGRSRRMVGSIVDITERKQAERALRESETRLKAILNNASASIHLKDPHGRYAFVNYRFLDIAGAKREVALGKTDRELFDEEFAEEFERHDKDALKAGVAVEFEEEGPNPRGGVSAYLANRFPLFNDRGELQGLCGILTDITERKRAEDKLRGSEERYRRLVELAPVAVFVHDGARILFSNAAGAKLLGARDPADMASRKVRDFIHPDYLEKFDQRMSQLALVSGNNRGAVEGEAAAGGPLATERMVRLDGAHVEVEGVWFPLNDYEGRRAIQTIVLDVGERKRAEAAQRSMLRIAQMANESEELGELFDNIRESLADVIDVTNFHIALRDAKTGEVSFPYFRDARDGDENATGEGPADYTPDKTLAAYVMRTRRPLLADERTKARLERAGEIRRFGSPSQVWLGVPLISRGRVVGVVSLQSYDDASRYTAKDLEIMEFVSGQIASAIERAVSRETLRAIERGVATVTGEDFFISLVTHLTSALGTRAAVVAELDPLDSTRARTLAVWKDSELAPNFSYSLKGTPCEDIMTRGSCQHLEGVAERFPEDQTLRAWNAQSFIGAPLRDTSGAPIGLLAVIHDQRMEDPARAESILGIFGARAGAELERKRAADELAYQAFHDALTGLPNRALFMDRLHQATIRAERHSESFAVLFIDLDRFKYVNDSLGHARGDELIAEFGRRLLACEREEDTVARWGGDEFTILVERIKSPRDATRVAERVLEQAKLPFQVDSHEVFVGASIGIALSLSNGERSEDLLRDADAAMYRAKAKGKSRYEIFDSSMHQEARELMRLEADLRRAVERREFRVFYQPKVWLGSGRVAGFEALARWEHPEQGLVKPGRFVALAEETGLIVEIDAWILTQACLQASLWRRERTDESDAPLMISANLSARHFERGDQLVERVRHALGESAFEPSALRLEITESVLMEDADKTLRTLMSLKDLGVRLELDDFGSGYASLSYLNRFPFDTLKIDRSFIRGTPENRGNAAIIMAIMALASNLGLEVTAEGIETEEQMEFLRGLGCELGQGYLFSPPLDPEAAEALLKRDPRW